MHPTLPHLFSWVLSAWDGAKIMIFWYSDGRKVDFFFRFFLCSHRIHKLSPLHKVGSRTLRRAILCAISRGAYSARCKWQGATLGYQSPSQGEKAYSSWVLIDNPSNNRYAGVGRTKRMRPCTATVHGCWRVRPISSDHSSSIP